MSHPAGATAPPHAHQLTYAPPPRRTRLIIVGAICFAAGLLSSHAFDYVINYRARAAALRSARLSSLSSTLQTLRSQCELYKIQHNDQYPALDQQGWAPLLTATTVGQYQIGPYLQAPPTNPLNGLSTIAAWDGKTPPKTRAGFLFNPATGTLHATDKNGLTPMPQ